MFEVSRVDDIAILHLFGEIALLEMERVQELINSLKKHNHNKILLDLANVDHIHFQAVKRWASEARELRLKNGDLKIACPNENLRLVIKFTGADQHLRDYSNSAEALLSFLCIPTRVFSSPITETANDNSPDFFGKGRIEKTEIWFH